MRSLPFRIFGALFALFLISLLSGCAQDRHAGTSSGVDNPSLTVAFVDAEGAALRVSGDLSLYAAEQNPVVDPQPLWTIQVRNSALADVKGDYLAPEAQAALKAAAKRAAAAKRGGAAAEAADSGRVRFNLSFKGQASAGALVFGLVYDSAAGVFRRDGGGEVEDLRVRPRALVRYQADLSRDPLRLEGVTRLYIPGTDHVATLTDTGFVFESLPEGVFPVRVMAGDGRILAVRESLQTELKRTYTADPNPVDSVRSEPQPTDSAFAVDALGPGQAFITRLGSAEVTLFAKVTGVDPARVSYRWRLLPGSDTARGVGISAPDRPQTVVVFKMEGTYDIELAAAARLRTLFDTITIVVTQPPQPTVARVVQPLPGYRAVPGTQLNIQWEMPKEGLVRIDLSLDSGATWKTLQHGYPGKNGQPFFPWIIPSPIEPTHLALVRVVHQADTLLVADMDGPFSILPKQ